MHRKIGTHDLLRRSDIANHWTTAPTQPSDRTYDRTQEEVVKLKKFIFDIIRCKVEHFVGCLTSTGGEKCGIDFILFSKVASEQLKSEKTSECRQNSDAAVGTHFTSAAA